MAGVNATPEIRLNDIKPLNITLYTNIPGTESIDFTINMLKLPDGIVKPQNNSPFFGLLVH